MNQKLNSIKNQINSIRAEKGVRARFPKALWGQIAECSEKLSLNEVCSVIGIDFANAKLRIKGLGKSKKLIPVKESSTFNFVQIPQAPKPTSPIMELTLNNGAIIKVFSV